MKKYISFLSSAALALFLAATGVVSGFAVEIPDDYSVEVSKYTEQSADISSNEVSASYPKITGFVNTANGTKVSRSEYSGAADLAPLAADLFKNQKGNCFRYAAGFACVARIAGYRSRAVIGTTAGSPHGWTEVLVNGEWLICDPDAQLPGYNVPDYTPYMMKRHYRQLTPQVKCEVTIENGKAVWK